VLMVLNMLLLPGHLMCIRLLAPRGLCRPDRPSAVPVHVPGLGSVKNLGRYAASWIAGWPNRPSSTAALT